MTASAGTVTVDVVPELHALATAAPEEPMVIIGTDEETVTALPPNWRLETTDHRADADAPTRSKGTVNVHDAKSFATAVRLRSAEPSAVVYADETQAALVAVLNDDDVEGGPGWRDYRVSLALVPTPEWSHWRTKDGLMQTQDQFAQHVEDGITELVEPEAATMLEIAQQFHATTTARFKTARRLASGEQQFGYEEDIEATAGTIEIPQRLKLVVRPFYGASQYEVGAWFRFRLNRDVFTLGYKLDRPHEIERAAFADIRNEVETDLGSATFLSGPAPTNQETPSRGESV